MNLPFSFALTNTNIYGLLWNPWGTSVANSVANAVLANLNADLQERYGLLLGSAMLAQMTGYAIMSDAANAQVAFGIWDTVSGQFDLLCPIGATSVAGGGLVRPFKGSGINLPVSATRIPAIKLTGSAVSVTITGDVDLILTRDFGLTAGSNIPVPDSSLLAEDGTLLTAETLAPLRTG